MIVYKTTSEKNWLFSTGEGNDSHDTADIFMTIIR